MRTRKLVVEVVDAHGLMPKDGEGSSSPYVIVNFDEQTGRTKTIHKDLNPVWNEKLEFTVSDPETMAEEELEAVVYSDNRTGSERRRKFLGRVKIRGSQVVKKGEEALVYFPLERRPMKIYSTVKGEIGLRLYYIDEPIPTTPEKNPVEAAAAPAAEASLSEPAPTKATPVEHPPGEAPAIEATDAPAVAPAEVAPTDVPLVERSLVEAPLVEAAPDQALPVVAHDPLTEAPPVGTPPVEAAHVDAPPAGAPLEEALSIETTPAAPPPEAAPAEAASGEAQPDGDAHPPAGTLLVEAPSIETPRTEAPSIEGLPAEKPLVEAPGIEAASPEAPPTESPPEAVPADVPVTEASLVEALPSEAPPGVVLSTKPLLGEVEHVDTQLVEGPLVEVPPTVKASSPEVEPTDSPPIEMASVKAQPAESPTTEAPSVDVPSIGPTPTNAPLLEAPAIESSPVNSCLTVESSTPALLPNALPTEDAPTNATPATEAHVDVALAEVSPPVQEKSPGDNPPQGKAAQPRKRRQWKQSSQRKQSRQTKRKTVAEDQTKAVESPPMTPVPDALPESLKDLGASGSASDLVGKTQYLFVRIVKAKALPPRDSTTGALVDPSVTIRIGDEIVKMRTCERTAYPEWNQIFAFGKDKHQSAPTLEISVWDEHPQMKEEFLGGVCFDLSEVPTRAPADGPLPPQWYNLDGNRRVKGEIMVAVWMGTQDVPQFLRDEKYIFLEPTDHK